MITIYDGLPGAGKTFKAVSAALRLAGHAKPYMLAGAMWSGSPAYVGMSPLRDVSDISELPDDAVLLIDDAQCFFPKSSRSMAVMSALSHVDRIALSGSVLLTCQLPAHQLDAFLVHKAGTKGVVTVKRPFFWPRGLLRA